MREGGGGGGGEVGERAGGTVEAHPGGDFVCAIEERGKEDGNRMRGGLLCLRTVTFWTGTRTGTGTVDKRIRQWFLV